MNATPGQVAYEKTISSKTKSCQGFRDSLKWYQLDDWDRSHWESAAHAVRAPLDAEIAALQASNSELVEKSKWAAAWIYSLKTCNPAFRIVHLKKLRELELAITRATEPKP